MKKPILTIYLIGFILLLGAVAQPVLGSNWPQFQRDEVNSGVTNDSAPIDIPAISWQHDHPLPPEVMGGIDACPIVYNGSVYAVIAGANLTKYYLNGTPSGGNWPVSFNTSSVDNTYDLQNAAPAAGDDGYIYVVDTGYSRPQDSDLYAINANTGDIADNVHVNDSTGVQFSTPVTYVENNGNRYVLFGSANMSGWTMNDGEYYCYDVTDPANMEMCWHYFSPIGYYGAGAAVIGNYTVFGNDAGYLVSVNYTNATNDIPEKIDEVDVSALFGVNSQGIRSSVTYSDDETAIFDNETGRVYFTSQGGYCYALGFNESNGSFITADKWSTSFVNSTTSTPAYYNGRIYVGNYTTDFYTSYYDGNLSCLNEDDGTEIWNVFVGPIQSSPAISAFYGPGNEYIYVTTNSPTGGIYCVDSDGDIVWSETSPGSNNYCLAGAAISGGWVFYGNDDGYLRGCANYTRYDFAVGAGADKWAYNYQVDNVKPSTNTVPNDYEFTIAEYADIASCGEGGNVTSVTDANGSHAAHRFVFKIDDNEKPWVTSLTVKWCGRGWHDSAANGTYLYIWNYTSSQYEELENSSTDAYGCLTGEVQNGSNYIDASGNVTVLVVQKSAQFEDEEEETYYSYISTDCIKLVVTP